MTTFSAYGMGLGGFSVDRPLNDYEKEHRLDVRKCASHSVHYDLSLIKFNSTFVECVDKWYAMRGFMAMVGFGFAAVLCFALIVMSWAGVRRGGFDVVLILIMCAALAGLWLPIKLFLCDAFTYTHYPIRMNRRNRQVYAFRRDGTVLKAGWDELVWTLYNTQLGLGGGDINVMGHLMHKDGITIKESIGLSLVDAGEPGRQNLLQFFEFFRRYMEQGPEQTLQALKPTPLIMLPGIDTQRESWAFGWVHLTGSMKGLFVLQVLFQVFYLPISLFRWIVMRTSKIPQWPQWVLDECAIEANDPWVRDERHRAGGLPG